ncbi:MAG: HD domain-containing protein [Phycisphaerae bacterium]|nr:HD domain-containing protein [Phycisphaerae bacterium]
MQTKQLQQFKQWYADYVAGFYGDDAFVNANLKLKEDHTARVCAEMNDLTQPLRMTESERLLAETIALFHDVGRYEQFTKYRTFSDIKSVPHGPLGVQVLIKHKVLEGLDPDEQQVIKRAIELHAIKQLPNGLLEYLAPFAKLIRDADKLDIYYLMTEVDNWPLEDPKAAPMVNWFAPGDGYSPEIIKAILEKRHIDYTLMKTSHDMKLLELAWVYDLNYQATFRKVRDRRYLEKIIAMLPDTPDIRKVAGVVLRYRDEMLGEETGEEQL